MKAFCKEKLNYYSSTSYPSIVQCSSYAFLKSVGKSFKFNFLSPLIKIVEYAQQERITNNQKLFKRNKLRFNNIINLDNKRMIDFN